jgi:glycosyltransferase involved in cell wall biosynthesis
MRIGVNGLFLKPGQVGGAEFVLKGLLIGLAQNPDIDLYVFVSHELVQWLNDIKLGDPIIVIPIKIIANRFIAEAFQIPLFANKLNLDGLINTNYFTPWKVLLKFPCATIIHDLNYSHFPDLFSWYKKLWLRLSHKITLANADTTVTISEFVKRDIKKNYGLDYSPKVIYNPILWDRFNLLTESISDTTLQTNIPIISQPFILSVANHYQHKNLATLVKAFYQLPKNLSEVKLVLVGQLPDSLLGMRRDRCDDIRQLVKELGLENRVLITGYISDRELAWYYYHAALFAFPSIFEGFGMPPVEALGMGLPVLTTNYTSIPEVTMNFAEYVENPMDVDEWCDRLTDMLNHREQYLPSEAKIKQIRQAYEPVAIAQKYIDLFPKLKD